MKKPVVKLTGTDGNVFSIIGKISDALKKNGKENEAKEFTERAFDCRNYTDVLRLCTEYVEVK